MGKYIIMFVLVMVVMCIAAEIAFKMDIKKYKKNLERRSLK